MSSNWEIDSYKTDYESEEHWELRKQFMLAHKDKFPEDELVCLAQVFTNIEFLGCRYPDKTMSRVAELAKGVVEKYRDDRKNSLKRTFVAASEAASFKLQSKCPPKKTCLHNLERANVSKGKQEKKSEIHSAVSSSKESGNFSKTKVSKKYGGVKTIKVNSNSKNKNTFKNYKVDGLDKIVLLLDNESHPINIMQNTASFNKCSLRWKFEKENPEGKFCNLYLNDEIVASGTGKKVKICKENAAIEAINKLKESNYCIKVKSKFFSNKTVSFSELIVNKRINSPPKIEENNVGAKLLKLMSWKGGGLGKREQGIVAPISQYMQVGRRGLGLKTTDMKSFKYKTRHYVRTWLKTDTNQDLVFSSEFSTEERKVIHEVAGELSLKAKSYGKNGNRQIVISRKLTPWTIIEELEKMGGSSNKYELVYPTKPQKS